MGKQRAFGKHGDCFMSFGRFVVMMGYRMIGFLQEKNVTMPFS